MSKDGYNNMRLLIVAIIGATVITDGICAISCTKASDCASFANCASPLSCLSGTCYCAACSQGYGTGDGGQTCRQTCQDSWCDAQTPSVSNNITTQAYIVQYPYSSRQCAKNGQNYTGTTYCQSKTTYTCVANYYGTPTSSSSGCTKCPTYSYAPAGTTTRAGCKCQAGYYKSDTASVCSRCPSITDTYTNAGMTSMGYGTTGAAGATDKSECYQEADRPWYTKRGVYTLSEKCYYSE